MIASRPAPRQDHESWLLPWRWVNALAAVTIVIIVAVTAIRSPVFGNVFHPGQYSDFKWPQVVTEQSTIAPKVTSRLLLRVANERVAVWAAATYAVVFGAWYLIFSGGGPAKPTLAMLAVSKLLRRPLDPDLSAQERAAMLNIAVKAVFTPLMTVWVVANAANVMNAVGNTLAFRFLPFTEWYWRHLHWALFWSLLTVDTLWFWCGYLVEHPRLRNTIRSVEPTVLGWVVTLACYPALNLWTGQLLGWHASDQPQVLAYFGSSPVAQFSMVALGLVVIVLMGIYAWASVALGFKASNLTNRGTVSDGPYRWVRHPAYAAKNLAWIASGLVPLAAVFWQISWGGLAAALAVLDATALADVGSRVLGQLAQAATIVFSLAAWAFIYHLRALTEERHLGLDPEYRAYCARVRWRYLPGVY